MRALFLSTLPVEGPSARPRLYAYERALRAAGIEPVFAPLLSSATARRFYAAGPTARGRRLAAAASGALERLARLCRAGSFDVVVVHRDILPRGNRLALSVLSRAGVPVVYDFDDAIYLSPRDFVERKQASRRLMAWGKDPDEVASIVEAADVVLAGNETLAAWARERSSDVRVQPTPVDTDRFRPRIRTAEATESRSPVVSPVVGWIGSPTATYCLTALGGALTRVASDHRFELCVVGAGEPVTMPGVTVDQHDWDLDAEAAQYASLDVGLYPLPDNEWTRGKCGYKALVYMACEVVPVVAPVGVSRELVEPGVRGFHATDDDEWVESVSTLLADPDLRRRMGVAGREYVEEHYSVRALEAPFVRAVVDAAGKRSARTS